jgi:DNA-binding NtrC family response regulator
MNILVVDENPGVRQTLAAVLGEEGHSVTTAASGHEGLEQALEAAPDFVIYDVHVADLAATAFVSRFHGSGGRSPVIVTYNYGNGDPAIEAMRHGAYDCLPKPFTTMELLLTLQKSVVREEFRKARGSVWG